MDKYGSFAGVNGFGCAMDCLHGIERIRAVAVDNGQATKPAIILGHNGIRGLLGHGNRYAVAVVLNDEDHRQTLTACAIQRLEYISFRTRGLALTAKDYRVRIIILDRASKPRGVLRVIPCRRRNVPYANRDLRKVIAHVTAAGGYVRALR